MANEMKWGELLHDAVSIPGRVNAAYRAFHRFSIGNQIAAACQLVMRGLDVSPIASYKAWQDKGRQVKKGEKAISLCMPVTSKKVNKETGEEEKSCFFVWRANWFSLSQTEGAAVDNEPENPAWDAAKAMSNLDITEKPFGMLNGNVQGYAEGRNISINPLASLPHKTRFHEMAHIMLGHTADAAMTDAPELPRSIQECEAESVAYILCSIFGLPGQEESRAYIQSWYGSSEIPEKNAKRIFAAADKILKAGQDKQD